jgi:hypothetical protein
MRLSLTRNESLLLSHDFADQRALRGVATGELFSGHTLKHVVAAFAAAPVLFVLWSQSQRQNGRPVAAQAA